MHFCYESEKTVSGPICSRIVALYHQNSHLKSKVNLGYVQREICFCVTCRVPSKKALVT